MSDKEKLFQEIKSIVKEWCEENKIYFKNNNINIDILRNEKEGFVVSFDKDIAMAELVVEQTSYAPYRFVSFEIVTVEADRAKISYSWYDNESTSQKELKGQLTKGINNLVNL